MTVQTPLMANSLGLILSFDLIEVFIYRQLTIFSFKCLKNYIIIELNKNNRFQHYLADRVI